MDTPLAWKRARTAFRWICLLLLPLAGACRNDQTSAPAAPPTAEQKDRRELLRQPKQEWKPENTPRKLNMLLLTDKAKIRKGAAFRYRLEMQNVGREPLSFKETAPSFIKDGSLCGANAFKFYAVPPGGKERLLPCKAPDAVRPSTAPAGEPESGLELDLQPGEYLLTRGSGPGGPFRELQTAFRFDALGTYRLKAVYAPAGGFRAVSNTVALEVVP
ncbi:MAG: hypothetical protein PHS14_15000 [Elusimicrobia bacterium]|nr:hypothetical protein [Elusimicrobiota bacterium]